MTILRRILPAIAGGVAFLAAPMVSAQEAGGNPQDEIKQLFKKVEKDLQEIDKLLLDASKDPRGAANSSSANASESSDPSAKSTAKSANARQREVSESIQKIMDLIPPGNGSCSNCSNHGLKKPGDSQSNGKPNQQQGQGQGGSMAEGQPQKSGQEQERQQQQNEEKTAQGAGQAPSTPKDGMEPKDPNASGDPNSPLKSTEKGSNGPKKPRDYDTERLARQKEASDRWGDLPEHVRKAFANENTDDLPMRYRKWIQDFYLRTAKSSSTSGK